MAHGDWKAQVTGIAAWCIAGVVAGIAHAGVLAFTSPARRALFFPVRLALVAAVLVAAALHGQILVAAAGWAGAYFLGVLLSSWRHLRATRSER